MRTLDQGGISAQVAWERNYTWHFIFQIFRFWIFAGWARIFNEWWEVEKRFDVDRMFHFLISIHVIPGACHILSLVLWRTLLFPWLNVLCPLRSLNKTSNALTFAILSQTKLLTNFIPVFKLTLCPWWPFCWGVGQAHTQPVCQTQIHTVLLLSPSHQEKCWCCSIFFFSCPSPIPLFRAWIMYLIN